MIIGTLTGSASHGFSGMIETLAYQAHITLESLPDFGGEDDPDWRILVGNPANEAEIGAGWNRTLAGHPYIEIMIDDPGLPAPLYAHLTQRLPDKRKYSIRWIRGDDGE
ncbi:DUF736 domain-containing protein [Sphingopyxis soli]|uniref:DUF736 domain-containing protein n=1 Tax=Sphingopyxis soli TaxID=592051 RepID=A0ABN1LWZ3_9SPHN|nr:DUF736 domain-containing protein [Sphingopyxis soli]